MYNANALKQLGMLFNFNEFYFFFKQKHVAEQCHKVPFEISNALFKEKKCVFLLVGTLWTLFIFTSVRKKNMYIWIKYRRMDFHYFIFDTYVHKLYALNLWK